MFGPEEFRVSSQRKIAIIGEDDVGFGKAVLSKEEIDLVEPMLAGEDILRV